MTNPHTPQSASLFLRPDGTLLAVRGDSLVELSLTPAQLLQLGMDALRIATSLQPACMAEALQALESTIVLPNGSEVAPCPQQIN